MYLTRNSARPTTSRSPPTIRMGSKLSKAKCPIFFKTKPAVVPGIPQDIIDEILDHLGTDSEGLKSLRSCSLVSKSWVSSCRRHLFHTISFTSAGPAKWVKMFPVPEKSPAHHVRDLRFSLGGYYDAPLKFFEYTPWFTSVEKMTLSGNGQFQLSWIPSFAKLPRSVTSLTIDANTVTLERIHEVMAQLPNLTDLSLSGSLAILDRGALPGIGKDLKGTFGGQLRLLKGHADANLINMLLEVPTGLHFREVYIRSMYECLLPSVRLVEACCKTLVKLSYTIAVHGNPLHRF